MEKRDNPCIGCVSKQYCDDHNGGCGDLELYLKGEIKNGEKRD